MRDHELGKHGRGYDEPITDMEKCLCTELPGDSLTTKGPHQDDKQGGPSLC
jgi:hypothetical protein